MILPSWLLLFAHKVYEVLNANKMQPHEVQQLRAVAHNLSWTCQESERNVRQDTDIFSRTESWLDPPCEMCLLPSAAYYSTQIIFQHKNITCQSFSMQ